MSERSKAVSIIIPFYNGGKFLNRCLTCATNQFKSFQYEIILIDDGSTDNYESILTPWLEKNKNIKLIVTKNQGVSTARNIGLNLATGEYIWFMDVDDLIQFYAIEEIYKRAKSNDLEIAAFGMTKMSDNEADNFITSPVVFKPIHSDISYDIISGSNYLEKTHGLIWEYACVWQYLFHRDSIKKYDLYFDRKLIYSEDLLFMWEILPKISRMCIFPESAYYYVQNPNSCLNSKNIDLIKNKAANMPYLAEIFSKMIIDCETGANNHYIRFLIESLKKDLIYRYMIAMQSIGLTFKETIGIIRSLKQKSLYPIKINTEKSPYMPHGIKWKLYLHIINTPWLYVFAMFINNFYKKLKGDNS